MFLRFVGILFFFPLFLGGGLAFTYLMELDLMTQSKLSVKWDLNGAAKRDVERKRRGRGKDEGEGGEGKRKVETTTCYGKDDFETCRVSSEGWASVNGGLIGIPFPLCVSGSRRICPRFFRIDFPI